MMQIGDVRSIQLPCHASELGELTVIESEKAAPFSISRVFFVRADRGVTRGQHAHRECSQLFVCLNGEISVTCDDGDKAGVFRLDSARAGLLVPPGIWATQDYLVDSSILMVVCDLPYDENDYIRDHGEFLAYRRSALSAMRSR